MAQWSKIMSCLQNIFSTKSSNDERNGDVLMSICVRQSKHTKESSELLAQLLGASLANPEQEDLSQYDLVVNYGSSAPLYAKRVINKPSKVKLCVNKISTLKRVKHGVEWTQDKQVALDWLKKDKVVLAREREAGHAGQGAWFCYNEEAVDEVPAKFWTRYFPHNHEVRINVFKGKILSVYDKKVEGEYFSFEPLHIVGEPSQVREIIDSISENIGIDMYGMDVLVNEQGKCKLLEINSGAALLPETDEILAKAILGEL